MNKHFIIVFTLCALFNIFTLNAFANTTSEQIYHFASNNDISSLYKNSDSLNALNKDGDTALCVAIKNNDVDAYKTLKKVGANTSPACIKNINKMKIHLRGLMAGYGVRLDLGLWVLEPQL